MSRTRLSSEHYTMFPNLAFSKIRQHIKDKKLLEIDISIYFLILDQYYYVAGICAMEKKPIKNVSVTIKSIMDELGISHEHAINRLKALNEAGLIFRKKAVDAINGNKDTKPAIYVEQNKIIDNSDEYIPLNLQDKELSIKMAADTKIAFTTDDDDIPF